MSDQISCFQMLGVIPIAGVSSAQAYTFDSMYAGLLQGGALGGWPLISHLQYRASAPSASIGGLSSVTALLADRPIRSSGTLTTSYDQANNKTTIALQYGSELAQIVVPLNLQCVTSLQAQVTAKTLTSGHSFSGSINGFAYQGLYTSVLVAGTVAVSAFVFNDAGGKALCAVLTDTSAGLCVMLAGAFTLASGTTTFSATATTGTFSQTNNSQTLSGSFVPSGFASFFIDASQSEYWSTH